LTVILEYALLAFQLLFVDRECMAGLPDFSLYNIPKRGEIYQIASKLPNGRKYAI
jgi:hypothetical protein